MFDGRAGWRQNGWNRRTPRRRRHPTHPSSPQSATPASHAAWSDARRLQAEGEAVAGRIRSVNRGGVVVDVDGVAGLKARGLVGAGAGWWGGGGGLGWGRRVVGWGGRVVGWGGWVVGW